MYLKKAHYPILDSALNVLLYIFVAKRDVGKSLNKLSLAADLLKHIFGFNLNPQLLQWMILVKAVRFLCFSFTLWNLPSHYSCIHLCS